MRITFDRRASDDLDRLFAWIAKDNPTAAAKMVSAIEAAVMRLQEPELVNIGRPGLVDGSRELIVAPYIIVYRVIQDRDEITVTNIVHGARQR